MVAVRFRSDEHVAQVDVASMYAATFDDLWRASQVLDAPMKKLELVWPTLPVLEGGTPCVGCSADRASGLLLADPKKA